MRKRKLGNTGLDVSILGLGSLCFGTRPGPGLDGLGVEPIDAKALLSAAADAGVTLIDIANVYG